MTVMQTQISFEKQTVGRKTDHKLPTCVRKLEKQASNPPALTTSQTQLEAKTIRYTTRINSLKYTTNNNSHQDQNNKKPKPELSSNNKSEFLYHYTTAIVRCL